MEHFDIFIREKKKKALIPPKFQRIISALKFISLRQTLTNKFLNTFVQGGGKKKFHTQRMNINFPRRRCFPPLRCVRHCKHGDDRDATPINRQLVGDQQSKSSVPGVFICSLSPPRFFFFTPLDDVVRRELRYETNVVTMNNVPPMRYFFFKRCACNNLTTAADEK